jgi:hypothetical protein
MDIKPNEIIYKKEVGKCNGDSVVELTTRGGLHMIIKGGKSPETLGVGSHRAIARHIAGKKKNVTWTELSKSDLLEPEAFAGLLTKYENMTDAIRKQEGF